MANRYRRFIRGPLEYPELLELADAFNALGCAASVNWDIFIQGGSEETVHFLDIEACYTQVSTKGDTHFIQTGQVQPLDSVVDDVLVGFLHRHPHLTCTCSHCYSHTVDHSDLAGAWEPNPSKACLLSEAQHLGQMIQEVV